MHNIISLISNIGENVERTMNIEELNDVFFVLLLLLLAP